MAVIAVVGVVVGALRVTGVFGKSKSEADSTLSVTAMDPSDDGTTDPTNDDTTDPTDDDTMQSNDPQDPLGQIDYQIKSTTKQGDTYTLQGTTVQILGYKTGAYEQMKAASSQDYKDDEAYVDVKIRLTNNGSQRIYPFDYRSYVDDPSSNNLMLEVEDSPQEALTSSEYVEVGESIERWMYFSTLGPPSAEKMKLYVRIPGNRYPKKVVYRREEPTG